MTNEEKAIKALEKIVNPFPFFQEQADKNGCKLDGLAAVNLANDVSFLKDIALQALKDIELNGN